MVRLSKKAKLKKQFQKKLYPTSQDIFKTVKRFANKLSDQEDPQKKVLQDWVQAEQIVKEQLKRLAQEKRETAS